jgi:hypothetical protein
MESQKEHAAGDLEEKGEPRGHKDVAFTGYRAELLLISKYPNPK